MLRSTSEVGEEFPYTSGTTCVIEVHSDGTVTQGGGAEAYKRALAGTSRLFAAWPGQWRTDLFAIDDLDEYARALGLVHDQSRTGLAEHEHDVTWSRSPHDSGNRQYTGIRLRFKCGCAIKDLGVFADHMKRQRGWDVARSGGYGSSGSLDGEREWSIRVRRSTLK